MHHFSLAFLERMADHMQHSAPVHQAHKNIPALHGPVKVCCQLPIQQLALIASTMAAVLTPGKRVQLRCCTLCQARRAATCASGQAAAEQEVAGAGDQAGAVHLRHLPAG